MLFCAGHLRVECDLNLLYTVYIETPKKNVKMFALCVSQDSDIAAEQEAKRGQTTNKSKLGKRN